MRVALSLITHDLAHRSFTAMATPPFFLAILHQDHANFLHLISAFENQVKAAESGHRPSSHILRGVLRYVSEYARTIHHPREDMLIELLKDREADQEIHIAKIRRDHRSLEVRSSLLANALETFEAEPARGRQLFVAAAIEFIAFERQHIADEERHLFPLALATLTGAGWEWLNSGLGDAKDPLFGEAVTMPFARLRQSIYASDKALRATA